MYCKHEDCNNPVENSETGLCATHSRLARKTTTQKRKPVRSQIKPISDKKSKEITEYSKRKKKFFSDPKNKICRVCMRKTATDIHHSKGKVGDLFLDERFWIPVCPSFMINPLFGISCHDWIETHPEEAKKLGFSADRLSKT